MIRLALMLSLATILCVALPPSANAQKVVGMDLSKGNSLQMQLCSLKPGRTMAEYEASISDYVAWSKEVGADAFVIRLTPMFASSPEGQPGFDWIEMIAAPFEISGAGWDAWLGTERGQALNAAWQEIADCRVTMNQLFTMFVDDEISAQDTRVVSMDWCTRHAGVSYDQTTAAHSEIVANRSEDSPVSAWSVVYPGLGMRNAPGEYMHLLSFANSAALHSYRDAFANNEGWRQRESYESTLASCTGENVYFAQVLNRPGA